MGNRAKAFSDRLIPDFFKPSKYAKIHCFADDSPQAGMQKDGKPAYFGLRAYLPKKGDVLGKDVKDVLGGKGAGLAEMINLNLNVPPVAIIPTTECEKYLQAGNKMDPSLREHVKTAIGEIEQKTGKSFFDYNGTEGELLLTLSVRSGARTSMPGMMDTVLNIGMNDERVEKMIAGGKDEHYVLDKQRRFLQYFGSVVLDAGILMVGQEKVSRFELALNGAREKESVKTDPELSVEALRGLIKDFKSIIANDGKQVPQDPLDQVMAAVEAVFRSSYGDRALTYKKENGLPLDMPTAVNIQAMVDGNLNSLSGSGVLFTRDKNTGENHIQSDFLENAQGEEVVSGARSATKWAGLADCPFDKELGAELLGVAKMLEKHYRDMVDIEYTIENGELYNLQVRSGKRSGKAAFKIACDLMDDGMITQKEAVKRITKDNILSALLPQIDPDERKKIMPEAKGTPASAGAGCGMAIFNADRAAKLYADAIAAGNKPPAMMLVKNMTKTEDYEGMVAAGKSGGGALTAVGGTTSHAAVVCGGNGIPAVVGCNALKVDEQTGKVTLNGKEVREGDYLTIDGATGEVFVGKLNLVPPEITKEFKRMVKIAKGYSQLPVLANADKPEEARLALELGAEGIGLCRTEHMFEKKDRIDTVRKMFLSQTDKERLACLSQLLPSQREDFLGIFNAMSGKPVTIRLLDPPMHEFLPDLVKLEREQATRNARGEKDEAADAYLEIVRKLQESDPMLGVRGVRLLMQYPEILDMQVYAILNAALDSRKQGFDPHVKIMVPVVNKAEEYFWAHDRIQEVAKKVFAERKESIGFLSGTMIEIPSACIGAGKIAQKAQFFSFGTNDLTQTGLGLSRDDTAPLIADYIKEKIYKADPFRTIDPDIAELMGMAVQRGRAANLQIEIGICGEQAVDSDSIRQHLYNMGLNTLSGTPMRGPLAIFTIAQIAIDEHLLTI